jgi:hypothetical protein
MAMTQEKWNCMTHAEKEKVCDLSDLSPQLTGLEGRRVEVTTTEGQKRRFIVGRSTGWKPIHLELPRRDSSGGVAAEREYASVKPLYRAKQVKEP